MPLRETSGFRNDDPTLFPAEEEPLMPNRVNLAQSAKRWVFAGDRNVPITPATGDLPRVAIGYEPDWPIQKWVVKLESQNKVRF